MNTDFTLLTFENFLRTFQVEGYSFHTFTEYCEEKTSDKYVLLRHDIDKKPENALKIALLEYRLGIKSSFYFLINSSVFNPEIIKEIASLGHEIGYHYRDLSQSLGNYKSAINLFQQNLSNLRSVVPVSTIAMDGSPWSKYDNRDLWKKYDYRDYGIIGEPYFDFLNRDDVLYFTDTGRCWDGDKFNVRDKRINPSSVLQPNFHSTYDFIEWIKKSDNQLPIMITTHPQRWTDNRCEWFLELLMQNAKNVVKRLFVKR